MLTGYSWRQMLTEGSVRFAQAIVDQLWNSRDRTSYHEQGTLTLLDHFVEGLGTRAFDLRCNWTWADTQSLNNECGMQCWGVWIPKSVTGSLFLLRLLPSHVLGGWLCWWAFTSASLWVYFPLCWLFVCLHCSCAYLLLTKFHILLKVSQHQCLIWRSY